MRQGQVGRRGQYEAAAESLEQAVKLNPQFYEALNNLAAALIELHRPIDAQKALTAAMKINPESVQLLNNLAGYYLFENNPIEALNYANKALLIDPDFVDTLKTLGRIHYKEANYDQSLQYYRQAHAISNDIEIIGAIAEILERRSEFDEAFELIKPLVDIGHTNPAILLTYSALSRKYNTQHVAVAAIETKLTTDALDTRSKINLHSELGKQYDALKEYDSAFNHYKQANLLDRQYNKQMLHLVEIKEADNSSLTHIKAWQEKYGADYWNALPQSGNTSNRPIFVVGMFRSGTTLAEQILSSHPQVHGAGELRDINQLSYEIGKNKVHDKSPAVLATVTAEQLAQAAKKYLNTLDKHSAEAKCVVDKMPSNFSHIGLITKLFPNAHIIHMIRDPRDVCLSMYFQRFGAQMTFSTDLEELADYHLAYQAIMKYWREVLDTPILDVVYEDLVDNQETVTRKMIEYCGLDWDDRCLNFQDNKRDINTPSYDQVRKPMYKKSVARWKNYESHLQPLVQRLKEGHFWNAYAADSKNQHDFV